MTTTRSCVAPEDVMTLLDGELNAADTRAVEQHLEECAACTLLADHLRDTSNRLTQWSVPEVPDAMSYLLEERAQQLAPRLRKRAGRRWTSGLLIPTGAAVLSLGFIAVILASHLGYEREYAVEPTRGHRLKAITPAEAPAPMAKPEGLVMREQDRTLTSVSNGTMEAKDGAPLTSPMIARVVSLTVLVKDIDSARAALDAIVTRHRGFSARMSVSAPAYGPHSMQASLRVPAAELAAATAEMGRLGRVTNESQTGEEVSQEHADLVARLKTARETEVRFQAILQQRTGKVSDVLEVEQNIARVRGEIEAMEGEQKGLEHRVEFATLEVALTQEYKAPLESQSDSVETRLHNALVAGYRNMTGLLLGLALFVVENGPPVLAVLLIVAGPVLLFWRRYGKVRGRM
jgi:hypothetical protein